MIFIFFNVTLEDEVEVNTVENAYLFLMENGRARKTFFLYIWVIWGERLFVLTRFFLLNIEDFIRSRRTIFILDWIFLFY